MGGDIHYYSFSHAPGPRSAAVELFDSYGRAINLPFPSPQIFEKVLVQNIQFGLSPSFTDALQLIPRWRFILACFPHVMQCAASMLQHR